MAQNVDFEADCPSTQADCRGPRHRRGCCHVDSFPKSVIDDLGHDYDTAYVSFVAGDAAIATEECNRDNASHGSLVYSLSFME